MARPGSGRFTVPVPLSGIMFRLVRLIVSRSAPMPKRSFGWKGFRVEVEVPARLGATLRRALPGRAADDQDHRPLVEFLPSVPPLSLRQTQEAVDRYMKGLRATLEWHPDGWGGSSWQEGQDLAAAVGKIPWYHTIELPGGVSTPGYYDHRQLVPHYGLPDDLHGKRVLDIGTWDGFWAFEFERRGADVTAVDLERLTQVDLPPPIRQAVNDAKLDQTYGSGFEIARRALGSKVKRIQGSVYELDPAKLGTFDLVHFADVALHLERPLEAFRRIRSVTAGSAMIVDAFHHDLDDDPNRRLTEYLGGWSDVQWWIPSLNTFAQMILDAGFSDVRVQTVYRLNPRVVARPGLWRAVLIARV
jgi:tRNA (mo5U34)-methyltransferase